ncbi:hypothetical protein LB535_15295 [Mesorhizobium sp. CA10]|uniref:hypothetical protein n=1 Tax=Mesorhizobium sp. CA10 TaxID=588495 RepID=UPI001CCBD1CD|nr:hypothetical protein [Mesorhizobium sp. CA10]MBZ9883718.1 hypothetical protein [Mesorhizobium sp. CA10]
MGFGRDLGCRQAAQCRSRNLVVSGANTYTDQTIVDRGTLRAESATTVVGSKAFQVNAGTLDLNGFDQTLTTLTSTGALGSVKPMIDGHHLYRPLG